MQKGRNEHKFHHTDIKRRIQFIDVFILDFIMRTSLLFLVILFMKDLKPNTHRRQREVCGRRPTHVSVRMHLAESRMSQTLM